jgi:hypothetical protein
VGWWTFYFSDSWVNLDWNSRVSVPGTNSSDFSSPLVAQLQGKLFL